MFLGLYYNRFTIYNIEFVRVMAIGIQITFKAFACIINTISYLLLN
jgi:hypothetical protein